MSTFPVVTPNYRLLGTCENATIKPSDLFVRHAPNVDQLRYEGGPQKMQVNFKIVGHGGVRAIVCPRGINPAWYFRGWKPFLGEARPL